MRYLLSSTLKAILFLGIAFAIAEIGISQTVSTLATPFIYLIIFLAGVLGALIFFFATKESTVGIWLLIRDIKFPRRISLSDFFAFILATLLTVGGVGFLIVVCYSMINNLINIF